MKPSIIKKVRETSPLIHHLTNQVVTNFSANGMLAFGASPIMAKAEEEASDMARAADAVLLNIGTLTKDELPAMIAAGKAANAKGSPVVLDPVGVAATSFRTEAIHEILHEVQPTILKANGGEMAHLVDIQWETKGVESVGEGNAEEIAAAAAKKYNTTAVVTGRKDIIATGGKRLENTTGHPLLTRITGAGCLLGSVLAACLTTDYPIEDQVMTALRFYGLAAEHAASLDDVSGPGTFLPRFLDALSWDVDEHEGDNR